MNIHYGIIPQAAKFVLWFSENANVIPMKHHAMREPTFELSDSVLFPGLLTVSLGLSQLSSKEKGMDHCVSLKVYHAWGSPWNFSISESLGKFQNLPLPIVFK